MSPADLEVIAVHAVVADPEVPDACAFALTGFDRNQHLPDVIAQTPQFVELAIVTRRDDTAIVDMGGGILRDGRLEQGAQLGESRDRLDERLQPGTIDLIEPTAQFG